MNPMLQAQIMSILKAYPRFRFSVDLGCGVGIRWLKNYTSYLVGVDKADFRLKIAKERGYDEVVKMDLRDYEIPNVCDSVFLFDCIEHIPKKDGIALLKKLKRKTIPFIMLTTPEKFFPFTFVNGHVSLWKEKELEDLGFKVTKANLPVLLEIFYGKELLAMNSNPKEEKWYPCIICFHYKTKDKRELVKHINDHKHVLMILTFPFYIAWHVGVKIIEFFLPPKKYPEVLSRNLSVQERGYKILREKGNR